MAGVAVAGGASLAIEKIEDFFALEIFRISKNFFLLTIYIYFFFFAADEGVLNGRKEMTIRAAAIYIFSFFLFFFAATILRISSH